MLRGASLLALLALTGCSSEEVAAKDAPDAATNVGYLATPECTPCLTTQCTLQLRACDADDTCRDVRACRAACTSAECDDACVSRLGMDGSASAQIMNSLERCAEWLCSTDCPAQPSSPGDRRECTAQFDDVYAALLPSCTAYRDCACTDCTEEFAACLEDADCSATMRCLIESGCVGVECRGSCGGAGVHWSTLAHEALICAQARCEPCSRTDGGTP